MNATALHLILGVVVSPSSQARETKLEILLSQTRFAAQDLATDQWSQDSLIYVTLQLPHQTSANEAGVEAVFPDHIRFADMRGFLR